MRTNSVDSENDSLLPKKNEKEVDYCQQFCILFGDWGFVFFSAWLLFLSVGTLFYYVYDNFSIGRSVYYAVNVAYSIGWCFYDTEREYSKLFSAFYTLLGLFGVGILVVFLSQVLLSSKESWFAQALREKEECKLSDKNICQDFSSFYYQHIYVINVYLLLIAYIVIGILFTMYGMSTNFDFINALYFTIGALSTAGLQNIPDSEADWIFAFVGVYTATGVLVLGVCVYYSIFYYLQHIQQVKVDKALGDKVRIAVNFIHNTNAVNIFIFRERRGRGVCMR